MASVEAKMARTRFALAHSSEPAADRVATVLFANTNPAVTLRGKPFLRWAGSKRKQLARLASLWTPSHQRYVEPFAGSACLFFELAPKQAILGDHNSELIEVYRVIRDEPDRIFRRLSRIRRDLPTYRRWRRLAPQDLDPATRALRFLYLNRNCFNGIYRTSLQGNFNVPMGRSPGAYFTRDDLRNCARLLADVTLIAGDFSNTIRRVRSGDFVYLDPPFAVTSRRLYHAYGRPAFTTHDIPRFAQCLTTIVSRGADFLVSYADCAEARRLASQWHAMRLPVRRHVAGFSGNRRNAYEWLISNMTVS